MWNSEQLRISRELVLKHLSQASCIYDADILSAFIYRKK